jgi:oxygen-dependent protoporphyrinogen oxidase
MRVVVIGGGVAGLSAAQAVRKLRPEAELLVLESASRVGGLIRSERRSDGFLLEHGPDSLLAFKPRGLSAVREVGLESQIVTGTGAPRTAYVVRRSQLLPLPRGVFAMSVDAAWSMLRSPLLSGRGRLRLLCEPFVPAQRNAPDESLASFVRRRMGREFLDTLAEPLIAGMYGAPPERLSARAVLPQLTSFESKHGSIGMAMLRRKRSEPEAARPGIVSLRDGMESLPEAMRNALGPRVITDSKVCGLLRSAAQGYVVDVGPRGKVLADAVVLAAPAYAAARLCEALSADLAQELSGIEHSGYLSIHLSYRRSQIAHSMAGTGFVVPVSEGRTLSACTWMDRKWPGRAPDGNVLIRCFVRPPFGPRGEVLPRVFEDLRDLMGIDAAPSFVHQVLRERGLPAYTVGHLQRVERMERALDLLPGFALAGNALRGAGIPDCIASGEAAAARALAHLN